VTDISPQRSLRVVDLSGGLPAAYCCKLLSSVGAETLSILPPGDSPDRKFFPGLETWLGQHRRIMKLDLKAAEDEALALIENADICITGFRPGSILAERFDPARLAQVTPHIIACWIRGFSASSDLSGMAAHDLIFAARYGLAAPGASPPPVPAVDLAAGMFAAFRILAALTSEKSSTEDRAIVVAMDQVAESWGDLADHFRDRWFPSYGGFQTSDGVWIALGFEHEDRQWQALCAALGLEREVAILAVARQQDSDNLRARLAAAISRLSVAEFERRMSGTAVAWTRYRG
jgi:alpha-methylacyl-CoA racemase